MAAEAGGCHGCPAVVGPRRVQHNWTPVSQSARPRASVSVLPSNVRVRCPKVACPRVRGAVPTAPYLTSGGGRTLPCAHRRLFVSWRLFTGRTNKGRSENLVSFIPRFSSSANFARLLLSYQIPSLSIKVAPSTLRQLTCVRLRADTLLWQL